MSTETEKELKTVAENEVKKAPRKPRPSELAAKKKKAVKKSKPKTKAKKAKVAKRPAKKATKRKSPAAGPDRSERIDMRVTKAQKGRVLARAKRLKRTVTSVVMEAIEKIK